MITELIRALQAGKQLQNSAEWKNAQNTTNAVAAILGAVVAVLPLVGVHLGITEEQVLGLAGGIAAVLGVCNSYLTVATTEKLGVRAKVEDSGNGGDSSGDLV